MCYLSIIIPVYNVENYLEQCLRSVTNQNLQDIEIIIIDDGSTDSSFTICKKFAMEDSRIELFSQKNKGLSAARNFGIKKSHGKYLMFLDSDDFLNSSALGKIVKVLLKKEYDIVIFDYTLKYNNKNMKDISVLKLSNAKEINKFTAIESLIVHGYAWNKIYKSSLFNNISFPNGKYYEDVSTIFKVFDKAKSFVYIPETLYFYVQRSASIMHTVDLNKLEKIDKDNFTANLSFLNYLEKKYPTIAKIQKKKLLNVAFDVCLDCRKKDKTYLEARSFFSQGGKLPSNTNLLRKIAMYLCYSYHPFFYLFRYLRNLKRRLQV